MAGGLGKSDSKRAAVCCMGQRNINVPCCCTVHMCWESYACCRQGRGAEHDKAVIFWPKELSKVAAVC